MTPPLKLPSDAGHWARANTPGWYYLLWEPFRPVCPDGSCPLGPPERAPRPKFGSCLAEGVFQRPHISPHLACGREWPEQEVRRSRAGRGCAGVPAALATYWRPARPGLRAESRVGSGGGCGHRSTSLCTRQGQGGWGHVFWTLIKGRGTLKGREPGERGSLTPGHWVCPPTREVGALQGQRLLQEGTRLGESELGGQLPTTEGVRLRSTGHHESRRGELEWGGVGGDTGGNLQTRRGRAGGECGMP